MKYVINRCYGGFGLSQAAMDAFAVQAHSPCEAYEIPRNHPVLVSIVEQMGREAWGRMSELKVVEIPDGVEVTIEEYDGIEWLAEVHRTWS